MYIVAERNLKIVEAVLLECGLVILL